MGKAIIQLLFCVSIASSAHCADKVAKTQKPEPFGDELLVQVKSSIDGTMQPCWFWAPSKATDEQVPLIVGLHTWSAGRTWARRGPWQVNRGHRQLSRKIAGKPK